MDYTIKLNDEKADFQVKDLMVFDRAGAIADEIKLVINNNSNITVERGDRLEVEFDGLTSGKMNVDKLISGLKNTIIGAISTPINAKNTHTRHWLKVRLFDIVNDVATNLSLSVFYAGVENHFYENVTQFNETDLAFLNRLCTREGYGLKIDNNRLVLFDFDSLINEEAAAVINAGDEIDGKITFAESPNRIRSVTVKFYSDRLIEHTSISGVDGESIVKNEYVADEAEAERFANGYLKNYKQNSVVVDVIVRINAKIAAGNCVTFAGYNKYDGKYYIDEVTYDIENNQSRIKARRIQA